MESAKIFPGEKKKERQKSESAEKREVGEKRKEETVEARRGSVCTPSERQKRINVFCECVCVCANTVSKIITIVE